MNPSILWAQDRTHLFITLEIPDFNNQEILFTSTNISIKGKSDEINYDYKIDLYNEIDSNNSSWVIKQNCIELKILKSKAYYWQKLTKVKKNNIKIDWQRWKDEDDEDDNGLLTDFSNFRETLPEEFLNQNLDDFINLNSNEINKEDAEKVKKSKMRKLMASIKGLKRDMLKSKSPKKATADKVSTETILSPTGKPRASSSLDIISEPVTPSSVLSSADTANMTESKRKIVI